MIFFIIDDFLLCHIHGYEELKLVEVTNSKKIFKIDYSNIGIQERVFKNPEHFKLINIKLLHCSYNISTIYEEMKSLEKFK